MGQALHSTCIPDIDRQHQALHTLLEHYRCASSQQEEQQTLVRLTASLRVHFDFVAAFFDIKFPAEFKNRQDEILNWVDIKIQQRNLGMITQETLSKELSGMLLHNSNIMGTKFQDLGS